MQGDDEILLQRRGAGFALEGPGYYLWDEDPQVVLCAAADLRGGSPPSREPVSRMTGPKGRAPVGHDE